jgi:hypothetical protein
MGQFTFLPPKEYMCKGKQYKIQWNTEVMISQSVKIIKKECRVGLPQSALHYKAICKGN